MENQINIFGWMYEKYKITKPVRLIELFAGYGSQAMAMKRLGVDFEHYKVVEFDKYAIASYNSICIRQRTVNSTGYSNYPLENAED